MTIKFPSTIGECIDSLYAKRAARLDLSKQVDMLKAEEEQLQDHILATFTKTDLRGAKGDIATASIKKQAVFSISDWDTFISWVEATDSRDCLQKRLSSTAIAARFADGIEVPGVTKFEKVTLSLTKAGA